MDILSNGDSSPCTNYRAGHTVHVIQALRSAADPGVVCRVIAIGDDGVIVLSDGLGSVWHHDPAALRRALQVNGDESVIYKAAWSVLVVQGATPERKSLFSASKHYDTETVCR